MCVPASCCEECGSVIPPHVVSSVLPRCPYVYAFVMACSSPDIPPPSCPPFPFLSLCPLQEVTAALARVIDRYSYQFRIASLQSADALNLKSITTSLTPQGWVKVCGYCTWLYVAQHTHQHVHTHRTHHTPTSHTHHTPTSHTHTLHAQQHTLCTQRESSSLSVCSAGGPGRCP